MDIATLKHQVKLANESPLEDLPRDRDDRKELAAALSKLRSKFESPVDRIIQFLFQPHQNAIIRTAVDLNLFGLIGEGGKQGRKAAELEQLTGAERTFIVRIMRVLTALGIFLEVGEQCYASTPLSEAWAKPPLRDGTKHLFDEIFCSLAHAPAFFKQTKYQNPMDSSHGLFQYAFNTPLGAFDYMSEQPEHLAAFNTFMEGKREGRVPWFNYFPFKKAICEGFKNEEGAVLLVDVGGGRGQILEALKNTFPDQPGLLIVQDLPQTVENNSHSSSQIQSMGYDFFTPQPVKGARSYYFRGVFHNWSDEKCREILRNTVDAMEKDYSRILINDWVLLDKGSTLFPACMDITMLALQSGMERTERQWRELLASVGLKFVKSWGLGSESDSLIEAVLE